MGKITGFLEFERSDRDYEPVEERIKHWREFVLPLPDAENKKQAARIAAFPTATPAVR
jgi:glutamate synthase (NADPH/NADH) small chain